MPQRSAFDSMGAAHPTRLTVAHEGEGTFEINLVSVVGNVYTLDVIYKQIGAGTGTAEAWEPKFTVFNPLDGTTSEELATAGNALNRMVQQMLARAQAIIAPLKAAGTDTGTLQ